MSKELTDTIEFVGSITPQDVEDGAVLVFRINTQTYPKRILDALVQSITKSVTDLFDGQVKAIIVPDSIEVAMLKDLLKEKIENDIDT